MKTRLQVIHAHQKLAHRFVLPDVTSVWLARGIGSVDSVTRRLTWHRGMPKVLIEALRTVGAIMKQEGYLAAANALPPTPKSPDFTLIIEIDGSETHFSISIGEAVRNEAFAFSAAQMEMIGATPPAEALAVSHTMAKGVPSAVGTLIARLSERGASPASVLEAEVSSTPDPTPATAAAEKSSADKKNHR